MRMRSASLFSGWLYWPMARKYVFDPISPEQEKARLRHLESIFDPMTHTFVGDDARWNRVLEVGPGAGALLHWLQPRCNRLEALDLNPRFLSEAEFPGVAIKQGDITQENLDSGGYGLIHTRFVLLHIPACAQVIHRLHEALEPGGALVVEDGDFMMSRTLSGPEHLRRAADRVFEAIRVVYQNRKMCVDIGTVLPELFAAQGVAVEKFEARLMVGPGQSAIARMMGQSITVLAEGLLASGQVETEDIEGLLAFTEDPACWALYFGYGQVLGRRKSG